MSEERTESEERSEERGRSPSLRGLARRIFDGDREDDAASEEHQKEERGTRELLISALATGDKAKTEIVRLIAREVRSYLEALELHKDLHYLLTNYSLDVQASFSLSPKSPSSAETPSDPDSEEQA